MIIINSVMGICNSVESAQVIYSISRSRTDRAIAAIKVEEEFSVEKRMEWISRVQSEHKEKQACDQASCLMWLLIPWIQKRWGIRRAIDGKTSNWLTVMPIACYH